MTTRSITTRVSKTDPTIKRILSSTAKDFKGLKVDVNEYIDVGSWWDYSLHGGEMDNKYWIASPTGSTAQRVIPPSGYGQSVKLPFPIGDVLVTSYSYGKGIWIGVEQLDPEIMSVALDTFLESGKTAAARVLAPLGDFAGLGMAIVSGRASSLKKGEAIAGGTKKSTRQIEREIQEALASRR